MSTTASTRLSAWLPSILVLLIYSIFLFGTPPSENPNEQSRLELTAAIKHFGSVSLDPVLKTYGTPFDRSERDGHVYTDKAPGMSLLAVPLTLADPILPRASGSTLPRYWSLRHSLTWLLIALPAVAFPRRLLRACSDCSKTQLGAMTVLLGLCTPLLTYSGVFFGHVLGGILAVGSTMLILQPRAEGRALTTTQAGLAGLLLGAAVTVEYSTALFGIVLGCTLVLRRAPLKVLSAWVAGGLLGVLPCLIYHQLAFGSPLATGYAFKADHWHAIIHSSGFMGITTPSPERLWGVLGSAKRGIFFFCPLLLLVPVGLKHMGRRAGLPLAALCLLYTAFAAGFVDWQAGWSAAARHLLPAILLSFVPLSVGLIKTAQCPRWAWTIPVLAGASLAGGWLSLAVSPFFPEHFSSPLAQLVIPSLLSGHGAPTALSAAGSPSSVGVVLCAGLGALALTGWALVKISVHQSTAPVLLLMVLGALSYTGGVQLVADPPNAEQLRMQTEVLRRIGYR
jgi:hypothetical protein